MSVAIDGALAGNGEAVEGVGIDEGCEILACLSLDAGGEDGEVGYILAALESAAHLYLDFLLCVVRGPRCAVAAGGHR